MPRLAQRPEKLWEFMVKKATARTELRARRLPSTRQNTILSEESVISGCYQHAAFAAAHVTPRSPIDTIPGIISQECRRFKWG